MPQSDKMPPVETPAPAAKPDAPKKPEKHAVLIAAKAAHLAEQIDALRRNERIVARVGGVDHASLGDEVAFQQARADVLTWAASHTAAEIVTRRAKVHAQLGVDGVAAKGGNMRGLPPSVVALICEAELLDLALGDL